MKPAIDPNPRQNQAGEPTAQLKTTWRQVVDPDACPNQNGGQYSKFPHPLDEDER